MIPERSAKFVSQEICVDFKTKARMLAHCKTDSRRYDTISIFQVTYKKAFKLLKYSSLLSETVIGSSIASSPEFPHKNSRSRVHPQKVLAFSNIES